MNNTNKSCKKDLWYELYDGNSDDWGAEGHFGICKDNGDKKDGYYDLKNQIQSFLY